MPRPLPDDLLAVPHRRDVPFPRLTTLGVGGLCRWLFEPGTEAEAQAFSRLLGVHVQRLATLAGGGHACTTHVPTGLAPASTSPTPVEGPR